jgi:hypothetical protein
MSKLQELKNSGHDAKIKWFYSKEDLDMRDEGEEYENILDIDFEMIPIQGNDKEQEEDDDFFAEILEEPLMS